MRCEISHGSVHFKINKAETGSDFPKPPSLHLSTLPFSIRKNAERITRAVDSLGTTLSNFDLTSLLVAQELYDHEGPLTLEDLQHFADKFGGKSREWIIEQSQRILKEERLERVFVYLNPEPPVEEEEGDDQTEEKSNGHKIFIIDKTTRPDIYEKIRNYVLLDISYSDIEQRLEGEVTAAQVKRIAKELKEAGELEERAVKQ